MHKNHRHTKDPKIKLVWYVTGIWVHVNWKNHSVPSVMYRLIHNTICHLTTSNEEKKKTKKEKRKKKRRLVLLVYCWNSAVSDKLVMFSQVNDFISAGCQHLHKNNLGGQKDISKWDFKRFHNSTDCSNPGKGGFQKFTLLLLHSSFPEAESKFCKSLQPTIRFARQQTHIKNPKLCSETNTPKCQ